MYFEGFGLDAELLGILLYHNSPVCRWDGSVILVKILTLSQDWLISPIFILIFPPLHTHVWR